MNATLVDWFFCLNVQADWQQAKVESKLAKQTEVCTAAMHALKPLTQPVTECRCALVKGPKQNDRLTITARGAPA
jgi:hypothetical protein